MHVNFMASITVQMCCLNIHICDAAYFSYESIYSRLTNKIQILIDEHIFNDIISFAQSPNEQIKTKMHTPMANCLLARRTKYYIQKIHLMFTLDFNGSFRFTTERRTKHGRVQVRCLFLILFASFSTSIQCVCTQAAHANKQQTVLEWDDSNL